jgi:cytidine deaminase
MKELVDIARQAMQNAYIPYSEYAVGAALEAPDSTVHTGCNIEVGNFKNTLHAEEVALAKAVSKGYQEFVALAITSSSQEGNPPCGMCRQSLTEFCSKHFRIYVDEGDDIVKHNLGSLLPGSVGQTDLNTENGTDV